MDTIEHYLNDSLDLSYNKDDILSELSLNDLFSRDNKKRFIDKIESDELRDTKNKPLKVKSGTDVLWKGMKTQLNKATSAKDLSDWGRSGKIHQLLGVTPTAIGKSQNDMSGGSASGNPSGEDWEAMIAIGLAKLEDKDPAKEVSAEWSRIEKKGFWDDEFNQGIAIKLAKAFKKQGFHPISQTGSGTGGAPVSSEWSEIFKEFGSGTMNKTPKTDLKGGSKKISLKKAGGSQAMSAKRAEAAATFGAAMRLYGDKYPSKVNKILDKFQKGVLDLSGSGYRGQVGDLKKDIESSKGDPEKMKKLKPFADNLKAAEEDAKWITSEMNRVFLSDSLFKTLFVFEAATGSVKFGDGSESRADTMVEIDVDVGKITSHHTMKTSKDVSTLAGQYKFYCAFKSSSGGVPDIALRAGLEKDPKKVTAFMKNQLNEGKEFSQACPTFATIIKEAFNQDAFGKRLLQESSFQQLNELQLLNKLVKGIKSVAKGVSDKFVKIWNWITERVVAAFDWLKKQGAKALEYCGKFFGVELDNCGISGKIELFSE